MLLRVFFFVLGIGFFAAHAEAGCVMSGNNAFCTDYETGRSYSAFKLGNRIYYSDGTSIDLTDNTQKLFEQYQQNGDVFLQTPSNILNGQLSSLNNGVGLMQEPIYDGNNYTEYFNQYHQNMSRSITRSLFE